MGTYLFKKGSSRNPPAGPMTLPKVHLPVHRIAVLPIHGESPVRRRPLGNRPEEPALGHRRVARPLRDLPSKEGLRLRASVH